MLYIITIISADKTGLSLSHLVPEILGPKVGLIFHQNILFDRFEAFYIIFSLIFDPIESNLFLHAEPSYHNLMKYPLPIYT